MTTVDDLVTFIERMDSAPWYEKARWSVRRNFARTCRAPSAAVRAIHYAAQRLRRGWDDRALWDIDHHLASTLGVQLARMGGSTNGWQDGYPGGLDGWCADLTRHGMALLHYDQTKTDGLDDDALDRARDDAKSALHWVADNLGSLWD